MAQKLFRDPLYDYIAIDTNKFPWILDIVDCPEVQRLRYINQLGLGQFTYPGATHSRFSHSLGVFQLMQECISHLKLNYPQYFKQLDEEALLAAALLHDIGHFPLSHVTEEIFGNHEEKGQSIINDHKFEVNKVLSKRASSLPAKVAALLAKQSMAPLWQKSLISSQLDMDRLDYLRRDSLYSGAEYGHFDCFRIIHTMQLKEKIIERRQKALFVVWPEKSKYAIEEYIFSRFYMYQSVYFHHTTRGFEWLVRSILKRAIEICKTNKSFAKEMLPPMKLMLGGTHSKDHKEFLALTDQVLLAQISLWRNTKDKVLRDLSGRLLSRKGIGWVEMSGTHLEMHTKIQKVEDYLKHKGLDHKYYFFEDESKATAYKPYSSAASSGEQSSVNSIILFDPRWPETGFYEISEVPGLERIGAITKSPSSILRYYFPKEHAKEIKTLLSPSNK
jgi:uncharacterized protein